LSIGAPVERSFAIGLEFHCLAVAREDGYHPGELFLIHLLLHCRVEALKPL